MIGPKLIQCVETGVTILPLGDRLVTPTHEARYYIKSGVLHVVVSHDADYHNMLRRYKASFGESLRLELGSIYDIRFVR